MMLGDIKFQYYQRVSFQYLAYASVRERNIIGIDQFALGWIVHLANEAKNNNEYLLKLFSKSLH